MFRAATKVASSFMCSSLVSENAASRVLAMERGMERVASLFNGQFNWFGSAPVIDCSAEKGNKYKSISMQHVPAEGTTNKASSLSLTSVLMPFSVVTNSDGEVALDEILSFDPPEVSNCKKGA